MRQRCNSLLRDAVQRIDKLTGLDSIYPRGESLYHQMAAARLPPIENLRDFQSRLYEKERIEVPCIQWKERQFTRISVQAYNSQEDLDTLLRGLE